MTRTGSALPIRSALDGLRLEFSEYRISQQVIGDRLLYLAEAADPQVRPVFAQAHTVDRLRSKLRIPEVDINAAVPTIARVYNFLLGGKDNFKADRQQARNVLKVYPQAAELVTQARAVTYAAQEHIGQFLDVGCGLPTAPNTHQTTQAITPDARIVYVDNDAQVLTHARNLLADNTRVLACAGDLAYPAEILYDWRIRQFLDFHQPLCLVLAMTMHFFPPDQAEKITAELTGALLAGSYVIMSVVGGDADLGHDMAKIYTAAPVYNHGHGGLARFMTGLDLIAPGIVPARQWRAPMFVPGHRPGQAWAAVGRKPAPADTGRS